MSLASLAHLAQPHRDADAWAEYRATIEAAIDAQPRSQQVRIGPSEIGTPCDRCLVHKLAGTPEIDTDAPWLPFIGTATHAHLEDIFMAANGEKVRYLLEATVSVGTIGGVDITGHADLFDLELHRVGDWKIVGKTTLDRTRRHGPSATYRTQAHLYGRGFVRRGLPVKTVSIFFLPRNAPSLRDALVWEEPYDEQVALDSLARADMFAAGISALGADAVLASMPEHTGDEFSCRRYPDSPVSAGVTADAFLGV